MGTARPPAWWPAAQRLHWRDGMDPAEIAEISGHSLSAVKYALGIGPDYEHRLAKGRTAPRREPPEE